MKVLIAHNRYRLRGGEERHVELLSDGLDSAGVEVHRFERDSTELAGSPVKQMTAVAGLTYRPGGGGISPVIDGWQPDVVHFHNIWPLLTPAALRAAKARGAKVVITLHNYRLLCPSGTLTCRRHRGERPTCVGGSSFGCFLRGGRAGRPQRLAYGMALQLHRRLRLVDRWVDAYIAPSKALADLVAHSGAIEDATARLAVIAYGVPIPASRHAARDYGLYAGRLSEEKGVSTLLEAASFCPQVPLRICGGGPLSDSVARARPGNVRYLGPLPPDDVAGLRRRSAFTVVPSEWPDVLPFSALESLASGSPIVASEIGGLPEVAADGDSLLVPPGDASALAAAMSEAWTRASTQPDWGTAACDLARRRFNLDEQTDQVIRLYERVVS
jgi:glycosyltransferase involved in cell wall biosynthesis